MADEVLDLLHRVKDAPAEPDPVVRIAKAVELVALELAAMRAVMFKQAKATKEMAELIALDLDPHDDD